MKECRVHSKKIESQDDNNNNNNESENGRKGDEHDKKYVWGKSIKVFASKNTKATRPAREIW